MVDPGEGSGSGAGYIVLRQIEAGHWYVVGDVDRRPGLSARASRVQAVADVAGGTPDSGSVYAVLPRSEWRLAQQL